MPVTLGLAGSLVGMDRRRVTLWLWVLVPVLVLTLLAMRNVKPWNPRYVAMVLPWLLALTGWGLARLPRRLSVGGTLLLIGLTLCSLGNYYGNAKYAKADVRSAAAFLTEANPGNDALLVPVVSSVVKYYYMGEADVVETHGRQVLADQPAAEEFCAEVLTGRTACWLVLGREWYFDPAGHLPRAMSRLGHLRLAHEAPGVRVYGWTRKEPAARQP